MVVGLVCGSFGSRPRASCRFARPKRTKQSEHFFCIFVCAFDNAHGHRIAASQLRCRKPGKRQQEEEEMTLDDLIMPAEGMTVGELAEKQLC